MAHTKVPLKFMDFTWKQFTSFAGWSVFFFRSGYILCQFDTGSRCWEQFFNQFKFHFKQQQQQQNKSFINSIQLLPRSYDIQIFKCHTITIRTHIMCSIIIINNISFFFFFFG